MPILTYPVALVAWTYLYVFSLNRHPKSGVPVRQLQATVAVFGGLMALHLLSIGYALFTGELDWGLIDVGVELASLYIGLCHVGGCLLAIDHLRQRNP
ncbi:MULTISPECIES: hypothetical protein [unclassified Variovorax]|uniref:hypothetical protein n=1 Tax=unclassified Variovorax TaxID=663243 RepID=UPI0008386F2F|nr:MULTISPECIES: hypothetical protein [unclassified Variovorax]PNG50119.1 hypothetical protein CHC06_05742 [Variovorax sp. B2]PNG50992.1 hypothetical protein CHC07_05648 [Variovorax sp. B4]